MFAPSGAPVSWAGNRLYQRNPGAHDVVDYRPAIHAPSTSQGALHSGGGSSFTVLVSCTHSQRAPGFPAGNGSKRPYA